jgi:hypothetical protein
VAASRAKRSSNRPSSKKSVGGSVPPSSKHVRRTEASSRNSPSMVSRSVSRSLITAKRNGRDDTRKPPRTP